MSLLRTPRQVALQELFRLLCESADHCRAAAQCIAESTVASCFVDCARDREALRDAVEEQIRETGDLPAPPDPDRESGEQLLQRLHARMAADGIADLIDQRRQADAWLRDQLVNGSCARDIPDDLLGRVTEVLQQGRDALDRASRDHQRVNRDQ